MRLNELRDNPGATKSKKRVGRGPGSGKGKTAGRGIKGQKSRSGVAINGYEGGQMPLYQRLPKRGFNNINSKKYAVINLGILQKFIDNGKIDIKTAVTEKVMVAVCSSVLETEQYFSNESCAARYKRPAGTSPVAMTLACMAVNKEGTCPFTRSPSTCI